MNKFYNRAQPFTNDLKGELEKLKEDEEAFISNSKFFNKNSKYLDF